MGVDYGALAKKRQDEQNKIKSSLQDKRIIEKLNISIPSDYKEKLNAYCEKNYISASALIRQWIDEHCI